MSLQLFLSIIAPPRYHAWRREHYVVYGGLAAGLALCWAWAWLNGWFAPKPPVGPVEPPAEPSDPAGPGED